MDLFIRVDGALPDNKLHHQVPPLQREIVVMGHGNDHLAKNTTDLGWVGGWDTVNTEFTRVYQIVGGFTLSFKVCESLRRIFSPLTIIGFLSSNSSSVNRTYGITGWKNRL